MTDLKKLEIINKFLIKLKKLSAFTGLKLNKNFISRL